MEITSVGSTAHSPAVSHSQGTPHPAAAVEQRELIHAVKAVNEAELFGLNNELTFILDRKSHRPVLRIVDRETREVVRQIPPEYALELARNLKRNRE
jgi:flagellar protein FlaG